MEAKEFIKSADEIAKKYSLSVEEIYKSVKVVEIMLGFNKRQMAFITELVPLCKRVYDESKWNLDKP